MPRRLFTNADLETISNEIRSAESRTSGEIVPLIVESSQDYSWVHWACGAGGALLATAAVYACSLSAHWGLGFAEIVSWQAMGAALGAALSFVPGIKRSLIPAARMDEAVHRQCLSNFMAMGLHETRDRTGVLIYLSLFEHRVEIVADRGIHEKLGQGYWESQVRHLADSLRSGQATKGLCEAVRQIGEKLAQDFPRREDDVDEHANELRFGHQHRGPGKDG